MEPKKKAIAGIIIAAITLASVAVAVSAEGEGGVGPMSILPGAITTSHIADGTIATVDIADNAITTYKIENETILGADIGVGSVNTTDILNETILGGDIKDGEVNASDLSTDAIASVINSTASEGAALSATTLNEIVNDTIELPRAAKLIITYTGNVTDQSTPDTYVKINCSISNTTDAVREWYECKPSTITFADNALNNVTVSTQFLNATTTTPLGNKYIRVLAWTTTGTANINDNMLTVIALPA